MLIETIKSGYKQTEIGIIPEDWDIDRIKKHALITTGAKNTQDKIEDGQYPFFVRSQNVERINSYSFDGEAVLTAGDGVGTGKVYHYIKGKFDFHQRVYKISNFDEKLDGYFFYLYFSSYFLDRIMSMTAKSSVDSVRMEMIADMQIPLPDKPEQIVIANSLRDIQELIDSLEKLIEKKKNLKKGVMQELLTCRIRLPGFNGKWETRQLDECGRITMGQSPPGYSYTNEECGKPLLNGAADLKENGIFVSQYTTKPTRLSKIGDWLFCIRATIGNLQFSDKEYCLGRGVAALTVNQKINSKFVSYQLQNLFELMRIQSEGGVIKGLRKDELAEFKIILPKELEEQSAIAQVLSDMDTEINILERERDKYLKIKKGMMQQLLTGRIRLKCH